MKIDLGCTMEQLVEAVNEASAAPSNMVTTDSAQTISGAKKFTGSTTFGNDIIDANNSAGTLEQFLMSQGAGKAPKWSTPTVATPSNMMTTNSPQTVYGAKTFTANASNSYPHNQVSNDGILIQTSSTASTKYGASSITRVSGSYGYTIYLPSGSGTIALKSEIPPKMSYYNVNFAIRRSSSITVYISWGVVAKQGYSTVKDLIQGITGSTTAKLNVPTSVSNYTYSGTTYSLGYLSTNGTPSGTTCYNTNGTSFTPYYSSSSETIGSIANEFKY